jgi:hypothetical protein
MEIMDTQKHIASMIKVEQLDLFRQRRKYSYKKTSELFDKYHVWEFIDDAFEGLHVQGAEATFQDIQGYIKSVGSHV